MNNIREIPRPTGDKKTADLLREYADRVESGEIQNFVLVTRDKASNSLERYGIWESTWELLGALEYAKAVLLGLEPSPDP